MLTCWMLICGGAAGLIWNAWFRSVESVAAGGSRDRLARSVATGGSRDRPSDPSRIEALWIGVFVVLAFLPVAAATLRPGVVYGPFDTNLPNLPWAMGAGRAYEPKGGVLNDVTLQFAPWQAEVRRQLLLGRLPLLNSWSGGGEALLGNGQAAPFSLVSMLALPFDPVRAQGLRAFLKVLLALLGTFASARWLGCRPMFALLAAVAYAYGGSMAVWQLFPHSEVMALFPFAFLGVERLLASPGDRRAAALTFLAACGMLLAGHPETALTAAAALTGRLASAWPGRQRETRGAISRCALLLCLAWLATSFFTWPLAQSVLGSEKLARQGSGRALDRMPGSAAWASAVNMAAPGIFGTPQGSQEHGPAALHWLAEGSVGLACLALAAAALLAGGPLTAAERYLAWLAVLAYAVHLDPLGIAGRVFSLPLLSAIDRRYFAYLGAFALALMAARGLERWCLEGHLAPRARLAFWGCAGASVAMALGSRWAVMRWWSQRAMPGPAGGDAAAALAECTRHSLVGLAAALGLLLCLALWRRPALAGLIAVLVAGGQLRDGYGGYVPVVPAAAAYPPLPLLDRLHQEEGPFRLAGTRGVFFPNSSTYYRLADIRTHDPTEPARYVDFLVDLLDLDRSTYKKQYRHPLPAHVPALRLLGIRFLLARADLRLEPPWLDRGLFGATRLWQLGGDTRWAFFPPSIVAVPSAQAARSMVRDMTDPYQLAALEIDAGHAGYPGGPGNQGNPGNPRSTGNLGDPGRPGNRGNPGSLRDPGHPGNAGDPGKHRAAMPNGEERVERISVADGDRLRLDVSVGRDAWLVLSQAAIPGWQARGDGVPLRTAVADGALLAARVPAGTRHVELRYLPASFVAGSYTSALALAAFCGLLWRWRRPHAETQTLASTGANIAANTASPAGTTSPASAASPATTATPGDEPRSPLTS